MKILGIDPGKSTGWAYLQFGEARSLEVLKFGVSRDPGLLDLEDYFSKVDVVVIESFLVRPKHARGGTFDYDPMLTPQVIGAAKLLARLQDVTIVEQSPSIKPVGYGFANIPYVPGKKGMHSQDAIAHAYFYAVKNAGLKPVSAL